MGHWRWRGRPLVPAALTASALVLITLSLPAVHSLGTSSLIPSWSTLESRIPSTHTRVFRDADLAFDSETGLATDLPGECDGKTIFYRDATGLCAYSSRVWVALEAKKVDYVTVLVDADSIDNANVGTDGGSASGDDGADCLCIPRVHLPNGEVATGSISILEKLDKLYPGEPILFPKSGSMAANLPRTMSVRFSGVFPRLIKPDLRSPYLRKMNGELQPRPVHEVILEEFDEILEEYDAGPFLCGDHLTCADVVWMSVMDRYSHQVPVIFTDLEPRGGKYGAVKEWFDAVENELPAWTCRVKGDGESWCSALKESGLNEEGMVTEVPPNEHLDEDAIWHSYRDGRGFVAETPRVECAAILLREKDRLTGLLGTTKEEADVSLREVCGALVGLVEPSKMSGDGRRAVNSLVRDWLRVPRDMGWLPAKKLRELADAAPAPRIP